MIQRPAALSSCCSFAFISGKLPFASPSQTSKRPVRLLYSPVPCRYHGPVNSYGTCARSMSRLVGPRTSDMMRLGSRLHLHTTQAQTQGLLVLGASHSSRPLWPTREQTRAAHHHRWRAVSILDEYEFPILHSVSARVHSWLTHPPRL